MNATENLTWQDMVELEPHLEFVDFALDRGPYGNPVRTYEELKRYGARYAGWKAERPELQSGQAYDVLVHHVANRLGL